MRVAAAVDGCAAAAVRFLRFDIALCSDGMGITVRLAVEHQSLRIDIHLRRVLP